MAAQIIYEQDPSSVRYILESLPEWFGDPEAIDNYVTAAGDTDYASALAVDSGNVVGVATEMDSAVSSSIADDKTDYVVDADVFDKAGGCGLTVQGADVGERYATVAHAYVATSGVSTKVSYTSGASNKLGVGVSATGAYGTFSASGTNTVSSSSLVGFPTVSSSGVYRNLLTSFMYTKYALSCSSQITVKARYFIGSDTYASVTVPSASYCAVISTGSYRTVSTSTASTFSGGAGLSSAIGINLSSQSGFSTANKATFTNSSGVTRHLCGVNDYYSGSPGRIVWKS